MMFTDPPPGLFCWGNTVVLLSGDDVIVMEFKNGTTPGLNVVVGFVVTFNGGFDEVVKKGLKVD